MKKIIAAVIALAALCGAGFGFWKLKEKKDQ